MLGYSEKTAISRIVEEIRRIITEASEFADRITANDLPEEFKNDERMCHFACANSKMSRNIVLDQAIKDGWVKYNEGSAKLLGAFVFV